MFNTSVLIGGGGGHTVEAYSSYVHARILYAIDFRSLLWTRMLRLRKPSDWFAFLIVLLICSDHLRSSDIVTPRYFADETLSSTQPFK